MQEHTESLTIDTLGACVCLRCSRNMLQRKVAGHPLKICPACKGLWFEERDFLAVLARTGDCADKLATLTQGYSDLVCTRCGQRLVSMVAEGKIASATVHHCLACQGYWLDDGKLNLFAKALRFYRPPEPDEEEEVNTVAVIREDEESYIAVKTRGDSRDWDTALAYYRGVNLDHIGHGQRFTWRMYLFSMLFGLPVEAYNPRKRYPVATAGIIAACLLVMLVAVVNVRLFIQAIYGYSNVPVLLIGSMEVSRSLTCNFFHAGWMHLILNMYILWIFGDNLEDVFGDHGRIKGSLIFLAFYAICGVASSYGHALLSYASAKTYLVMRPCIGASGAVAGVMAAYWRLFPRVRLFQVFFFVPLKLPIWVYMIFWLGSNALLAALFGMRSGVSWAGHLSGFAAGWFLLRIFLPYELDEFRSG